VRALIIDSDLRRPCATDYLGIEAPVGLSEVLNNSDLRQLKQRIALRCVIKPLPNVEETDRYIASRLLVAGAERTDIFSAGAIDYIFRCSEGIPRNINNLCDNALLAGYGAGEPTISRAVIEEVAETFDMLPSANRGMQPGEERESPARIFSDAGRAELWAAGTGPPDSEAEAVSTLRRSNKLNILERDYLRGKADGKSFRGNKTRPRH
jgi:general secretion pathway protein A